MATTSMDYEATGERYDGKRPLCFVTVTDCDCASRCTQLHHACNRYRNTRTNQSPQMTALATTATVVRRLAATTATTLVVAPCPPTATTGTSHQSIPTCNPNRITR
jgi:hypothetical protein